VPLVVSVDLDAVAVGVGHPALKIGTQEPEMTTNADAWQPVIADRLIDPADPNYKEVRCVGRSKQRLIETRIASVEFKAQLVGHGSAPRRSHDVLVSYVA
jgi:hypothetical protein